MRVSKVLLATFVVGGALATVGQALSGLYVALLGPASPFVAALTLVSMGLLGAVLFALSLYQRIEKVGGFGAMLPFSGMTAAIAGTFAGAAEGVPTGKAFKAAIMLFLHIVGWGTLFAVGVGVVAFFAK